jgi:UPF0716 family protein affecting phage T7 exclusion
VRERALSIGLKSLVWLAGTILALILLVFVVPRLGMWRDLALMVIGIAASVGTMAAKEENRNNAR